MVSACATWTSCRIGGRRRCGDEELHLVECRGGQSDLVLLGTRTPFAGPPSDRSSAVARGQRHVSEAGWASVVYASVCTRAEIVYPFRSSPVTSHRPILERRERVRVGRLVKDSDADSIRRSWMMRVSAGHAHDCAYDVGPGSVAAPGHADSCRLQRPGCRGAGRGDPDREVGGPVVGQPHSAT